MGLATSGMGDHRPPSSAETLKQVGRWPAVEREHTGHLLHQLCVAVTSFTAPGLTLRIDRIQQTGVEGQKVIITLVFR